MPLLLIQKHRVICADLQIARMYSVLLNHIWYLLACNTVDLHEQSDSSKPGEREMKQNKMAYWK